MFSIFNLFLQVAVHRILEGHAEASLKTHCLLQVSFIIRRICQLLRFYSFNSP